MANIYEEKSEPLHELLDAARSGDGATVLIPDLQRPYVWTPNQVTLLIDSLIRGWPFGTLLMWRVGHGELQSIPHRSFWQVVDRTSESGSVIARRDPPASYRMVLDGQQRVQSLLLALGGDAWGFKMEDRAWALEVQERRLRGRQGKYRHWSKATLCLDVEAFGREYSAGGGLQGIEFRNVLSWVVTDPVDGRSTWPKQAAYEEPLLSASQATGRFVRLSRLWAKAVPNPNLREAQFRQQVQELFAGEGISDALTLSVLPQMGELMVTLRDLKLTKVTYLELRPFEPEVWTEDSYNDAIVNIFTRLNTAGRVLTREEITLAWLKVGWNSSETDEKTAGECFETLLAEVRDRGVEIGIDDLVSAVSFIWSICCNDGRLLASKDLLRGATIRPMAADLSKRWSVIRRTLLEGLDAVRDRELEYGNAGHFSSVNALAVVWAWLFIAFEWDSKASLTVVQRDSFLKSIKLTLASRLDRWLICSQWAGRWADSAPATFAGYARELRGDFDSCLGATSPDRVCECLGTRLEELVRSLETDAASYVTALNAPRRERVVLYRNALWVWHRLDETRWRMSEVALRLGRRKPALDVDHTVGYALWLARIKSEQPAKFEDETDSLAVINALGNCSLLEKAFNISKSAKSLRSFMEEVHEVKKKTIMLDEWAHAMCIDSVMLEPSSASIEAIADSIRARDKAMRDELIEFVKGTKERQDL